MKWFDFLIFGSVLLLVLGSSPGAGAVADEVTFNKDIAPILYKQCAGCHRPGEIGPFSLLKYADAAKRAGFIKEVTASRQMPPWKAEPGFGDFNDERRLSNPELDLIARWADSGAKEGNSADLPAPPRFTDGWQLGAPDMVVTMPREFTVAASGPDLYRCFVIPIPVAEDRTVAAVEFRPGNRKVVHHALMFLDAMGQARKKDGKDGKPGYQSFGGPGVLPTGSLGGWAPGAMPRLLPDGTGLYLRGGSDLVLSVHYHPSGKEETDRSTVGIYFTKRPAARIVGGIILRSRKIDIPPGEKRHVIKTASQPLPVPVEAVGITPHMHLIGREMKVVASLPDGATVPLIWIKDWDFNWQGAYRFKTPVRLPKGTVFSLEAVYDNSAENLRNPSHPPKQVRWGEQTTDEMCLCGVAIVTESRADLRKVMSMNAPRLGLGLVGGTLDRETRPRFRPPADGETAPAP